MAMGLRRKKGQVRQPFIEASAAELVKQSIESTSNPDRVRSELLAMVAKGIGFDTTGAGVKGAKGYQYVERKIAHSLRERSQVIQEVVAYLRGEDPTTQLDIYGKALSYDAFIQTIQKIATPRLSEEEAKFVVTSFASMIESADAFGEDYNSIPMVEEIDYAMEKETGETWSLATSFGIGQLQPEVAKNTAIAYGHELEKAGLLTSDTLIKLKGPSVQEWEVVEALDLKFFKSSDKDNDEIGYGNILMSVLAYYDGLSSFAMTKNNTLDTRIKGNTKLAVTSYIIGKNAPVIARIQTHINDMMIMDPALQALVTGRLQKAGVGRIKTKLLHVTGVFDPQTEKTLAMLEDIHNKELRGVSDLTKKGDFVGVSMRIAPLWKSKMHVKNELSIAKLASLVSNRFSSMERIRVELGELQGRGDDDDAPFLERSRQ